MRTINLFLGFPLLKAKVAKFYILQLRLTRKESVEPALIPVRNETARGTNWR